MKNLKKNLGLTKIIMYMFDKVCGSGKIRELFTKRMKYSDIEEYLNKDVESFRKGSSKYYLYK